jgi:DNA-binding SARP family transcriptional activator
MWPDADADSAVNSLNQTVFQLRRYLDPTYRAGESPEYVISTSDQVSLNPDLVHTDLAELRRLPQRVMGGDWHHRNAVVGRALDLVAGEFVGDVKYEEWATRLQLSVHNEVRRYLLPIAQSSPDTYMPDTLIRTAEAILRLDPFDEAAVLALADALAASGRRVMARTLVVDYIRRVRSEMDDEPSSSFVNASSQYQPR